MASPEAGHVQQRQALMADEALSFGGYAAAMPKGQVLN
jgi:hypothetical protein